MSKYAGATTPPPGNYGALYEEVSGMSGTLEYTLTLNTELAQSEIRKLELTLIRIFSMLRRMTGNENLSNAMLQIQKMITLLRTLTITMHAVEMASGPIGWAFALTSIGALAISTTDYVMSLGE